MDIGYFNTVKPGKVLRFIAAARECLKTAAKTHRASARGITTGRRRMDAAFG
ncbi:MAG: hypothetical protein PHE79_06175 [Eubacteriales bacterium]|nr:hypothetical protein [Eubacteriales bacterium]